MSEEEIALLNADVDDLEGALEYARTERDEILREKNVLVRRNQWLERRCKVLAMELSYANKSRDELEALLEEHTE